MSRRSPTVDIQAVSLGYGETTLVRRLTFRAAQGAKIAVVGPSGVGKSTLLRALAGLHEPLEGRILLSGQDPVEVARSGKIGMAFQDPTLVPWKSALDNVLLPIRLRRRVNGFDRERARRLLELVGLQTIGRRLPAELSGGMRQRVAVARALVGEPQLLLLDEPFAWLDEFRRLALAAEMETWTEGTTTIMVTHAVTEAVLMADRILVLHGDDACRYTEVNTDLDRPRTLSTLTQGGFHEACNRVRQCLLGFTG